MEKKIGVGIAVGIVTFGIGGLVARIMTGNKKFVEFFCELPDGRAFLGRTERKGYLSLIKLCPREKQEELDVFSKLRSG